jgi:hypothetical protein
VSSSVISPKKPVSLLLWKKGLMAAERGEFIEEEEMDARLQSMFKA